MLLLVLAVAIEASTALWPALIGCHSLRHKYSADRNQICFEVLPSTQTFLEDSIEEQNTILIAIKEQNTTGTRTCSKQAGRPRRHTFVFAAPCRSGKDFYSRTQAISSDTRKMDSRR